MAKSNSLNSIQPVVTVIEPSNQPLIDPSEVQGGAETTSSEHADNASLVASNWAAKALSERAEADKVRLVHQANCATAIADYLRVVSDSEKTIIAGDVVKAKLEQATAGISRSFSDAVLANAYDRVTVRRKLGEAFGFEPSKAKAGKFTSKPLEPGNTIAKRVSSATIGIEYALTGTLPEKGGDNLPLVDPAKLQEAIADYFPVNAVDDEGNDYLDYSGTVSVRTVSERIENLIREAKVNLPVELSADKLLKLAGKIESASQSIADSDDAELRDAYVTLMAVIQAIPFQIED